MQMQLAKCMKCQTEMEENFQIEMNKRVNNRDKMIQNYEKQDFFFQQTQWDM